MIMNLMGVSKNAGFKKVGALLICAALMVSLAACGKDSKKNTDSTNSAKTGNSDSAKEQQNDGDDTVSIIAFEDDEDEDDVSKDKDNDTVTTTTTTNTAKKKTTTTAKETTTKKETTTTTAKKTTTTTVAAVKRDNSYKITAKKYSDKNGDITYTYPQISGLYDEQMQNFYNELFKSGMSRAVKESNLSTLNVTYEVTLKTKDTLSIVFRGGQFYEGAAHPYGFAYAYTIDLATGETINPADFINMNKAADAIANDTWKLARSADGVKKSDIIEYFNQFSEDQMKSYMSVKDTFSVKKNAKGQYYTEGSVGCNSYLNAEEKPVLILEVNHALGDYVEVKF